MVLLTSTSALLTLIALVASIDGDRATVEGELVHYLRPADVGQVQYEITVGSELHDDRGGHGRGRQRRARRRPQVRLTSDREVLPGFEVRFEVPFSRVRDTEPPAEELLAARSAPTKAESDHQRPAARVKGLEIERRVRAWAEAWSSQDVATYLSFYAEGFEPPGGMSRYEWAAHRTNRLRAPRFIQVRVGAFELEWATPERAIAHFEQSYRSDTFQDRVNKTLVIILAGGEWKILAEGVR